MGLPKRVRELDCLAQALGGVCSRPPHRALAGAKKPLLAQEAPGGGEHPGTAGGTEERVATLLSRGMSASLMAPGAGRDAAISIGSRLG